MDKLLELLRRLYDLEINCGLQSFFDDGVSVWIGDDMNGRTVQRKFRIDESDQIVPWLQTEAARMSAGEDDPAPEDAA